MKDQTKDTPKLYSAPKLTVHGTVTELTAGGSRGRPESNAGREIGKVKP